MPRQETCCAALTVIESPPASPGKTASPRACTASCAVGRSNGGGSGAVLHAAHRSVERTAPWAAGLPAAVCRAGGRDEKAHCQSDRLSACKLRSRPTPRSLACGRSTRIFFCQLSHCHDLLGIPDERLSRQWPRDRDRPRAFGIPGAQVLRHALLENPHRGRDRQIFKGQRRLPSYTSN